MVTAGRASCDCAVIACALVATTAHARGVSPYLPVNLAPEIERKIERVLILAGQPMLKRPIAAATVLDALPAACERDAALCADVRRYLTSLARTAGISYATFTAGATAGADTPLPNRHGMSSQSNWEAAAAVYWQPGDHFLVSRRRPCVRRRNDADGDGRQHWDRSIFKSTSAIATAAGRRFKTARCC